MGVNQCLQVWQRWNPGILARSQQVVHCEQNGFTQLSGNPTINFSTFSKAPGWLTQHVVPNRICRLVIEGQLDPLGIAREECVDCLLVERRPVKLASPKVKSLQSRSELDQADEIVECLGVVVTLSVPTEGGNAGLPAAGVIGDSIGTNRSTSSLTRLGATGRKEYQNGDH